MSEPILAQYVIRSKQDYIFRSNQLKEITGGSRIIASSFDALFDRPGISVRKAGEKTFCMAETMADFAAGNLAGVELFTGGGNCTLLLKDADTYRALNRAFTRHLLREYPGLVPMAMCTVCTGDYGADYAALMAAGEQEKNRMTLGQPGFCAPFAQMDRTTNQPLAATVRAADGPRQLTAESRAKLAAVQDRLDEETKLLDKLTTQREVESLLAIVHADGNNMGKKIQHKLQGKTDYDACVAAMRAFTAEIQSVFVEAGKAALAAARTKATEGHRMEDAQKYAYRILVADGDDFTFICNARLALEYTTAYLNGVAAVRGEGGEAYSSCAGICLFHSGYPASRAYLLAEQACDSAKEYVHRHGGEECWLDFHYIHAGVDGDLENIRKQQRTEAAMARPWRTDGTVTDTPYTTQNWGMLADLMTQKGSSVTRTNLKTLAAAWEDSSAEGLLELERLNYRQPELIARLTALFGSREAALKALYDFTEGYDLWVSQRKEG